MSTIGHRLREERERLLLTQSAFGELGGVQKGTQIKYEADERAPDVRYMAAVGQRGVDVLYVITGQRQPAASAPLALAETSPHAAAWQPARLYTPRSSATYRGELPPDQEGYLLSMADVSVARPLVLSVHMAGADDREYQVIPKRGGPSQKVAELAGVIAMERSFMRSELGRDGAGFLTMTIDGDSMAPVLCHGETVVIDAAVDSVRDSGLYAVAIGQQQVVRRLIRRMDGGLLIRMDNPAYASAEEQCSAEQAKLVKVLGLVVWPRLT